MWGTAYSEGVVPPMAMPDQATTAASDLSVGGARGPACPVRCSAPVSGRGQGSNPLSSVEVLS